MKIIKEENFLRIRMQPQSTLEDLDRFDEFFQTIKGNIGNGETCLLDLSNVNRIYSIEIGLIIRLYQALRTMESKMAFINTNPEVERVLLLIKLNKLIPVYKTEEEWEKGAGK